MARNPWKARMRLWGVVAVGVLAGCLVGALMVKLIIMRWSTTP